MPWKSFHTIGGQDSTACVCRDSFPVFVNDNERGNTTDPKTFRQLFPRFAVFERKSKKRHLLVICRKVLRRLIGRYEDHFDILLCGLKHFVCLRKARSSGPAWGAPRSGEV